MSKPRPFVLLLAFVLSAGFITAKENNEPLKVFSFLSFEKETGTLTLTEAYKLGKIQLIRYELSSSAEQASRICYAFPEWSATEMTNKLSAAAACADYAPRLDFSDARFRTLIAYEPTFKVTSSSDRLSCDPIMTLEGMISSEQFSHCTVLVNDKEKQGLTSRVAGTVESFRMLPQLSPYGSYFEAALKQLRVVHAGFPENESALVRRNFILTMQNDGSDLYLDWLQQALLDADADVVFAALLKVSDLFHTQRTLILKDLVGQVMKRWFDETKGGELCVSFQLDHPIRDLAACIMSNWDNKTAGLDLRSCKSR